MRKRAPRRKVEEMIAAALPVLNGIITDSGDIMDRLHVLEMKEPGTQYERELQKARAIRRMAEDIQTTMRKLSQGLVAEEALTVKADAAP